MPRAATIFDAIPLPGTLAGAAVFLSLALFACIPALATEVGPPAAPSQQPPASTFDRAGEPAALKSCGAALPPTADLFRRCRSVDRSLDSRHTESAVLSVRGFGTSGGEFASRLARFRGRFPAATPPPVYVLFCTWLT